MKLEHRADREAEFEVVWNGGPLLPERDQNPADTWTAPRRAYHRTGKHIGEAARYKSKRKQSSKPSADLRDPKGESK